MATTRRAAVVAVLLVVVAAAGFLFLRRGSDTAQFPDGPPTTAATTTATTTAVPSVTVVEPDEPAPTTTTTTVPAVTVPTPPDPDEPAPTTTTTTVPAPPDRMPPEPDEWWTYNADPDLEWRDIDLDRLVTDASYQLYVLPKIDEAAEVAQRVKGFWSWYMTLGHPQGDALDLSDRPELAGDAVGQLMFIHHRFWQERLPAWRDVWNREFEKARSQQRNKLIYLDALGELNHFRMATVGPTQVLFNPGDETSVWRYWGPIIRPDPDPTAPLRSGGLILPDDSYGACGPDINGIVRKNVSWECVHLGPAEDTALGDWDAGWYFNIPHEHAAWYVGTLDSDGPPHYDRYDPDRHGAPTSRHNVADGGWLMYLPDTVADGASPADIVEAWKPYRPEGFPDDPDAYREMWRHDVGGGWWHKEMGQLVLLVPADELVAWLEANGYDPQRMFARGWPNPHEERLIRNTWGKDWDPDNPADWRNRLAGAVGWLEQGVEIGDSGNLAADIEAAIHISAWMDWAYRSRLGGDRFPNNDLTWGWNDSAWMPGVTSPTVQDRVDALFAHRPDGWATSGDVWQGLYHQALADGYHPDAATGRLTHPALNPELAVWKEWAAAGEAEKWLGFQAADGNLGPAPGDMWIPWYPEEMVPLENHYLLPEHGLAHWETTVDWWPDGGLETPVHQPDWHHAFTVAGPYVAEAGGHMFETCLWATGGLFSAWSLPHPELDDASLNVTWIVRGIADRGGRIVKLAEPVNRPCIEQVTNPLYGGRFLPYEDWQQRKTDSIDDPNRDAPAGSTLPVGHHFYSHSRWEERRQGATDYARNAFNYVSAQAELDTPARYTDWVLGGARSRPEEFMRSTYHIVGSDQLRQPGAMHWLYNDGTAVHVDDWTLPESEAEGLHNGVTVTPLFVRRGETDRTVTAGHIGARVHNDWSWANVVLADPDDPWIVDGENMVRARRRCPMDGVSDELCGRRVPRPVRQ